MIDFFSVLKYFPSSFCWKYLYDSFPFEKYDKILRCKTSFSSIFCMKIERICSMTFSDDCVRKALKSFQYLSSQTSYEALWVSESGFHESWKTIFRISKIVSREYFVEKKNFKIIFKAPKKSCNFFSFSGRRKLTKITIWNRILRPRTEYFIKK